MSGADFFDSLNNAGVYGELTVGTSPIELKVGGSALDQRRAIHMMAKDNSLYWGYSNSVTTTTGTRLFKSQWVFLPIGADVAIWLVADGAGKKVSIAELA